MEKKPYNYQRCTFIPKEFGPSVTEPDQGYRMRDVVRRSQAGAPVGQHPPVYMPDDDRIYPASRLDYPIEQAYQDFLSSCRTIDIARSEFSRAVDLSSEERKNSSVSTPQSPPTDPSVVSS